MQKSELDVTNRDGSSRSTFLLYLLWGSIQAAVALAESSSLIINTNMRQQGDGMSGELFYGMSKGIIFVLLFALILGAVEIGFRLGLRV